MLLILFLGRRPLEQEGARRDFAISKQIKSNGSMFVASVLQVGSDWIVHGVYVNQSN